MGARAVKEVRVSAGCRGVRGVRPSEALILDLESKGGNDKEIYIKGK